MGGFPEKCSEETTEELSEIRESYRKDIMERHGEYPRQVNHEMERFDNSPTIFSALEEALQGKGLQWSDLESVVIKYKNTVQRLNREEAKEVFSKGKLLDEFNPREPHNIPFFAYTKDRIFYTCVNDESDSHWISSLPRNPAKSEEPVYLPN